MGSQGFGMDQIVRNIVSLGLLIFLFAAIARRAPNDRSRCWVAGWVCVLIQTGLKLWEPHIPALRLVNACASIFAVASAAIFFVVSTMVVREGRKAGLRLGGTLAISTLPCLVVVIALPRPTWLLIAVVILWQGMVVRSALGQRPNRRSALSVVLPVFAVALAWMVYGVLHKHTDYVVLALLGELFFVAAADFWFSGWERTLGLIATCAGLATFAAMFPGALLIPQTWPGRVAISGFTGVSAFCAAIGMILIVLEEDARFARTAAEEYRLTFDSNPHPLWILDKETLKFLAVNEAACLAHRYTREEFLSLGVAEILEPGLVTRSPEEVDSPTPIPNRPTRHIRKDGSVIEFEITAHDIVFRGRPARFALGIDVSEREELQRQVLHHARHDHLTGLPNRGLFEERLEIAIERAVKDNERLAVLSLNLDRFKRINDSYGTAVGDECLKRLAEILRAQTEWTGLTGRMGGDRFAIALTGIRSGLPLEHMISELMDALRQPVLVGATKVRMSITAGLALCPEDGTDFAPLWRSAESALQRARDAGSGQVAWSSPDLRIAAEQQMELDAFMRTQLEEGGFHLVYQPLYAMDGEVEGLEALLRLTHPIHGPISPSRFIPVAEETGLIHPIGDWVIEEVCRQLSAWRAQGFRSVPVALNVSGLQLVQGRFAERLIGFLHQFEIGPEQIQLEVTESTNMLNLEEVMRQMAMLADIGIRFAIDDFGTGHSTLNRLDKLPLGVLKIDRTFTERLCEVDGTRSIVQAMISMAKALKMRVVAEGVERQEQIVMLHDMGCDSLQGFLLSRPVPALHIPSLVERRHPALTKVGKLSHKA